MTFQGAHNAGSRVTFTSVGSSNSLFGDLIMKQSPQSQTLRKLIARLSKKSKAAAAMPQPSNNHQNNGSKRKRSSKKIAKLSAQTTSPNIKHLIKSSYKNKAVNKGEWRILPQTGLYVKFFSIYGADINHFINSAGS